MPTWVPLAQNDPLGGYVNTDNIETFGKGELGECLGTLSPASMLAVNRALAVALGLS
jgi:mRNA interferase MazF